MFAIANTPTEFSALPVDPSAPAVAYCRRHKVRFLTELKAFTRFASVSAQRHVEGFTPASIRSFVRKQSSAKPAMIDRRHPAMRAAFSAYRSGFGAMPVFLRSGGTIPVIALLQDILKMQTVLIGFALPDDRVHAPNEKFHLPNFYNGVATSICFLDKLADRSIAANRGPAPPESQNGGAP